MQIDADSQTLLLAILESSLSDSGPPLAVLFRIARESQRALIDSLIAEGYIDSTQGARYRLTPRGLGSCDSEQAKEILSLCESLVPHLKDLYRSQPGANQSVAELAKRSGNDVRLTAAALTFLFSMPIAATAVFDGLGSVQAFTLSESILDIRELSSHPSWLRQLRRIGDPAVAPTAVEAPVLRGLESPSVFISYSHDSSEHKARVLGLANRMRSDGLDVMIDRYLAAPPAEGWPQWCAKQILSAEFVLMICTDTYSARVSGVSDEVGGMGAKWEGAIITQQLYQVGGLNERFIPVVFSTEDIANIPAFVSMTSRYDLSAAQSYEDLYRRITGQPAVLPPPLGSIRRLPPERQLDGPSEQSPANPNPIGAPSRYSNPFMILNSEGAWMLSERAAVESGDSIVVELLDADPRVDAFMEALRAETRPQVAIAYGLSAASVRLTTARLLVSPEEHKWVLTFERDQKTFRGLGMELSTGEYSADKIAQFRAERLLLNHTPSLQATGDKALEGLTIETLIRGLNSELIASESPFPSIFATIGPADPGLLPTIRMLGLVYLRLTGTVEHTLRFDVQLVAPGVVAIDYEGVRPRAYVNVSPSKILVSGQCVLGG